MVQILKSTNESPGVKKLSFIKTNHVCTKLLQKTKPNALHDLRWTRVVSSVFFWPQWQFLKGLHRYLILIDFKDFWYGVYWGQDEWRAFFFRSDPKMRNLSNFDKRNIADLTDKSWFFLMQKKQNFYSNLERGGHAPFGVECQFCFCR
jgi:hypothetical protein